MSRAKTKAELSIPARKCLPPSVACVFTHMSRRSSGGTDQLAIFSFEWAEEGTVPLTTNNNSYGNASKRIKPAGVVPTMGGAGNSGAGGCFNVCTALFFERMLCKPSLTRLLLPSAVRVITGQMPALKERQNAMSQLQVAAAENVSQYVALSSESESTRD